jgi:hypothetical protein
VRQRAARRRRIARRARLARASGGPDVIRSPIRSANRTGDLQARRPPRLLSRAQRVDASPQKEQVIYRSAALPHIVARCKEQAVYRRIGADIFPAHPPRTGDLQARACRVRYRRHRRVGAKNR